MSMNTVPIRDVATSTLAVFRAQIGTCPVPNQVSVERYRSIACKFKDPSILNAGESFVVRRTIFLSRTFCYNRVLSSHGSYLYQITIIVL